MKTHNATAFGLLIVLCVVSFCFAVMINSIIKLSPTSAQKTSQSTIMPDNTLPNSSTFPNFHGATW